MKNSYTVEKVKKFLNDNKISVELIEKFQEFYEFVLTAELTASRETHYVGLNEWSEPIYDFIHNELKANGFVNGDPVANKELIGASFWWLIYQVMGSIIYSNHLSSVVAIHHSSAYERNVALQGELEDIIEHIMATQILNNL
jgi:hypothetical protein